MYAILSSSFLRMTLLYRCRPRIDREREEEKDVDTTPSVPEDVGAEAAVRLLDEIYRGGGFAFLRSIPVRFSLRWRRAVKRSGAHCTVHDNVSTRCVRVRYWSAVELLVSDCAWSLLKHKFIAASRC